MIDNIYVINHARKIIVFFVDPMFDNMERIGVR